MKPIKRILIIRFRQIGDSILAVALCSTLKKSFPDAEIHFVLNKNIASLYEGHPDIDKVITFDKNENKPFTAYIKKVYQKNKLIYGGSLNQENIVEFKTSYLIDGYLLGGLSLKPQELKDFISKIED